MLLVTLSVCLRKLHLDGGNARARGGGVGKQQSMVMRKIGEQWAWPVAGEWGHTVIVSEWFSATDTKGRGKREAVTFQIRRLE